MPNFLALSNLLSYFGCLSGNESRQGPTRLDFDYGFESLRLLTVIIYQLLNLSILDYIWFSSFYLYSDGHPDKVYFI